MAKKPLKREKERRSRGGLSLKRVNLDKINRQLLNVLIRETIVLLKLSHAAPLSDSDSDKLLSYLKVVKTLREDDLGGENLTDEELEKLAGNR